MGSSALLKAILLAALQCVLYHAQFPSLHYNVEPHPVGQYSLHVTVNKVEVRTAITTLSKCGVSALCTLRATTSRQWGPPAERPTSRLWGAQEVRDSRNMAMDHL